MSDWVKCSERMPAENESCIVYRSDISNPQPCNMYWNGSVWIPDGYGFDSDEELPASHVSHWQPLPLPPKE